MGHREDIRGAVESNSALIMLGTGFTAASVGDRTNCSWPGLLRSGLDYVKSNFPAIGDKQLTSISNDIEIGELEDSSYLLGAASKIVNALQGSGSVHFNSFISQTIGAMQNDIATPGLATAIESLGIPVCTVNYDTVYEKITGSKSSTWRDARQMRSALTDPGLKTVVHLHGVWDDPESIILTTADYTKIVADAGTEAIRSSVGLLKTIIFIGFGDGLHDPHFASLWGWLSALGSGATHYVLCREGEVRGMLGLPASAAVIQVPYGADFSDLQPFVESLTPDSRVSGKVENFNDPGVIPRVARTARAKLMDLLTDSSIMRSKDDCELGDLVVEPILLPVPPEAFAQEKMKDDSIVRLDAHIEAISSKKLVVVGEEQSGLTTSLRWMALKCSDSLGTIPIVMEYSSLTSGANPVDKAVRKQLRARSAPVGDRGKIPYSKISLYFDNVSVSDKDDFLRKVVYEVEQLNVSHVIYGCRPGVELRVLQVYEGKASGAKPVYLGPIGLTHATELARRIDPQQAPHIAERVLAITRKERLSRTPLAIILLIVGVSNEDGWINAVSNTTFVDSFVDSLLGRGKLRDDMRSQVDSAGYSRVLEAMSRRLISDDSASINRVDLIVFLAELVDTLDWSESPDVLVRDLINKGLLVDRDASVSFRQSAYLHIFAARAAVRDRSLLELLMLRPLYYGQIIRHYAALKRDDEELVKWAFGWVRKFDDSPPPRAGLFGSVTDAEIERNSRSIQALADELVLPEVKDEGDSESHSAAGDEPLSEVVDGVQREVDHPWSVDGGVAAEDEDDVPEVREITVRIGPEEDDLVISDVSPFPSTQLEDAPIDLQLTGLITLVSNILRDSELVENPTLKEEMLASTLSAWGRYMDVVGSAEEIRSMIEAVVDAIATALDIDDSRKETLSINLTDSWSMHAAYQGISEELSTRKLRKAMDRVASGSDNESEVYKMIPLYMLDQMHENKFWGGGFAEYLLAHSDTRAARIFVRNYVRTEYIKSSQRFPGLKQLEDLLVDFYISDASPRLSARMRGRIATRYRQRLQQSRARSRAFKGIVVGKRIAINPPASHETKYRNGG